EVGPSRATIITYVNPAVAIALGVALLGEPLTAGMLVGFPLVLLGSVVGARRRRVPATDTTSPTGATGPAAATEMPPPPALPVEEPVAAPTLEAEVIATAGRSPQGCVPR
ncbi:MAG: EamA family transporter, partial [Actinomycetales bacterium]